MKKELLFIWKNILGYEIIDIDANISKYLHAKNAIIAVWQIKSHRVRVGLFEICKNHGFAMAAIILPLAYVSKHAVIGEGTAFAYHALINAGDLSK